MRTSTRFFGLFAPSLLCIPVISAQTNPPPPDPHETVTREPRTLSKPAERSAALGLLDRARHNYNLHDISAPYALKVSFETNGAAQTEGEGTMEELSDGGSHWRWTAKLPDSLMIRIGVGGRVYGTNPSEIVPLRVQMIRSALHWPIMRNCRCVRDSRCGCRARRQGHVVLAAKQFDTAEPCSALVGRDRILHRS
jgi:hypothetical protein